GHAPPGDFIALGSKSQASEPKAPAVLLKPASTGLPADRKREATSALPSASGLSGLTKRPKLSSTPPLSALGRLADVAAADKRAISPSIKEPSVVPIEIPPALLLEEIEAAEGEGNDDQIEGVLCGAVKQLKMNRAKPDITLYLSLMFLAKIKPNVFATEGVIEALCSLLRRDASINFKAKGNNLVSVLACNLLMAAYEEDENWPEIFVKVYIEDSLGERIWVDSSHCKNFVDNIQTAFGTKMPPKSMLLQIDTGRSSGELSAGSSPHPSNPDEDDNQAELLITEEKLSPQDEGQVMPRYEELAESVEDYVLDVLRDQLNRRQPMDNVSRNLLRLLTATCGYKDVRQMTVQRLEMWLQNVKSAYNNDKQYKRHAPPGDFIALGSKSQASEPKAPAVLLKPASTGLPADRKREATSALPSASGLSGLTKRPKLSSTPPLSALGRLADVAAADKRAISPSIKEPSVVPIEIPPALLLEEIEAAEGEGNDDQIEGVLCGAVKQLKMNRAKPDITLYLSLMFLAKIKPNVFATEGVIEALCSLLRRDASINFKAKGNNLVSVLACNLLMAAYEEDENWPEIFVKPAEGAVCPWSACQRWQNKATENTRGSSPHPSNPDEDDNQAELLITEEKLSPQDEGQVMPRYEELAESVEDYVLDVLRDQLNRRQPMDNVSRNLLRLLTATCGYKDVRQMTVQRLEMWLQNPKFLAMVFQDLLTNKDDYLRASRALLREIIKQTKHEINFQSFCLGLMQERKEPTYVDLEFKVYIEDSLGERIWVDSSHCKNFVDNIQTAFGTKMPPKSMLFQIDTGRSSGELSAGSSPHPSNPDEDDNQAELLIAEEKLSPQDEGQVMPRFCAYSNIAILLFAPMDYVLDVLRDQLNRRQPMDNVSRNLLRLLTATCGYKDVRQMTVQRLEMWLQNPKLTRPAQDLLMSVCMNCNTHGAEDMEVASSLIKIRLKPKVLLNHYMLCVRELLNAHRDNLGTMVKFLIFNELSNARNPNNMQVLYTVLQHSPEQAPKFLAMVFQDLLTNKDDYLRASRALLREIIKQTKHEINFQSFCLGLMQERKEPTYVDLEFKLTVSMMLGITSQVKEAGIAWDKGEKKNLEVLRAFQNQIAAIQRDTVWWLHTVVPTISKVGAKDYVHCLHKLLFTEQPETYYKWDNWPPESDRNFFLRLCSEVPLLEDTLMRILVIGLSRDLPLGPADAMELADHLVKRAAAVQSDDVTATLSGLSGKGTPRGVQDAHYSLEVAGSSPGYSIADREFPGSGAQLAYRCLVGGFFLRLCSEVPLLEDTLMRILVIGLSRDLPLGPADAMELADHLVKRAAAVQSDGLAAWDGYPTLKMLMEMVMTNNYSYPPCTVADEETKTVMINRELQVSQREKQEILAFESHLAAASTKQMITESNSLLLSQLTSLDPQGPPRRPPPQIQEQVKSLNQSLRLGHLLCRSRSPDFLLNIIQRQASSQSMPWLADLVQSSEGSLDVLPVQCLCEFLLHDAADDPCSVEEDEEGESKEQRVKKRQARKEGIHRLQKQRQLLGRLQDLLLGPKADEQTTCEVLDYFLRRLSSSQVASRVLAMKGLSLVLTEGGLRDGEEREQPMEEESGDAELLPGYQWLLQDLPKLPLFDSVRGMTSVALQQAIHMETDPQTISAYLIYLSQFAPVEEQGRHNDLALDVARLIVERSTIMSYLFSKHSYRPESEAVLSALGSIFSKYIRRMRKTKEGEDLYSWSESQDQVFLRWTTGETATMHILVVHAMVILLTLGPPKGESDFYSLLDIWFPEKKPLPTAFLVDTSEEALLLPDWLKLRMIRSEVSRLVDAALQDLEPQQLLLFVQSFGIPVSSMSKLLQYLDQAVSHDPETLEQNIMDKTYMAHLVEVQHERGATGGHTFHTLLSASLSSRRVMQMLTWLENPAVEGGALQAQLKSFASQYSLKHRLSDVRTGFLHLADALAYQHESEATVRTIIATLKSGERCNAEAELIGKVLQGLIEAKSSYLEEFLSVLLTIDMETVTKHPVTGPVAMVNTLLLHEGEETSVKMEADAGRSTSLIAVPCAFLLQRCVPQDMAFSSLFFKAVMQMLTWLENPAVEGVRTGFLHLADALAYQHESEATVRTIIATLKSGERCNAEAELIGKVLQGLIEAKSSYLEEFLSVLLTIDMETVTKHPVTGPVAMVNTLLLHEGEETSVKMEADAGRLDPSSSLDFLWACIHIPRIWQGRDQKTPQKRTEEFVLCLKPPELICLVDLILSESEMNSRSPSQSKKTLDVASCSLIQSRLPLLHSCCHGDLESVKKVSEYLINCIKKWGDSVMSKHCQNLLLQIYLQVPEVIQHVTLPDTILSSEGAADGSICKLDVLVHRLITLLADTGDSKSAENRMSDANMACRKLAVAHPVLLLRHLPMIAALLHGRIHLNFQEFRQQNHLSFFTHVLAILELLHPLVFQSEHQRALQDSLLSFIQVLQSIDKKRSEVNIKHMKYNGSMASETNCKDHAVILSAGPQTVADEMSYLNQWSPILVLEGQYILEVLSEVDEKSKRSPEILPYFANDFQSLMNSPEEVCRNIAFSLALRCIQNNPCLAVDFLPTFMYCMGSGNFDVVQTALRNLPEYVLLCQEHADVLLHKAFLVGIYGQIDTSSIISEAMKVLHMEATT
ncbi:UNVERIFIED_CONTAM: hypothetical protein FKN15_003115, partial [Acipenser sinensis]